MSEPKPQSLRVRTSDAEREKVVTVLRTAVGEGRLTLEEGDQRIAAAYAATYRDELGPLTTDLPGDRDQRERWSGGPDGHWHNHHWHDYRRRGPRRAFVLFPLLFLFLAITLLVNFGVHWWLAVLIVIFSIMALRRIVWIARMRRHWRRQAGQDTPWAGRGR